MNMRVLEKSRKKQRPGDIFVFQMPDELFRFGRVIRVDASVGVFPNCILLYIYDSSAEAPSPIPHVSKDRLLIAPIFINRLPWSRGYFKTLENRPLGPEDVHPAHCFYSPSSVSPEYFDEYGNELNENTEPCGIYVLSSFRTIDYKISDALGIPQKPD